ncbi:hypothetical protein SEVIR_9G121750v4 [Setaria viridis]
MQNALGASQDRTSTSTRPGPSPAREAQEASVWWLGTGASSSVARASVAASLLPLIPGPCHASTELRRDHSSERDRDGGLVVHENEEGVTTLPSPRRQTAGPNGKGIRGLVLDGSPRGAPAGSDRARCPRPPSAAKQEASSPL